MAKKVSVSLVDDLDASEGADTVTFGLDGVTYEIDLSPGNADGLRDALAPYLAVARRAGRGRRPRTRAKATPRKTSRARSTAPRRGRRRSAGASPAEIRDWARGEGWTVSDRGRIPAELLEAYRSAH